MSNFTFPFAVSSNGRIQIQGGDEALRGKIIQMLFTAPGERVNLPDFGCGLFNLVFEPNDMALISALEFTVAESLNRWLRDEIQVSGVQVSREEVNVIVEVAYARRPEQTPQALRLHFK